MAKRLHRAGSTEPARAPPSTPRGRALAAGFGRDTGHHRLRRHDPLRRTLRRESVGRCSGSCLLGLEDPPCNAHGENESLDLGDFRKASHALAHHFAELDEARWQPQFSGRGASRPRVYAHVERHTPKRDARIFCDSNASAR